MKRRRKVKLKRKSWILLYLFVLVFSTIFGFLLFHKKAVPILDKKEELKTDVEIYPIKEEKLSIVMVGDCLIHPPIYEDAYKNGVYDFKPMLSLIKPIVSKYDLAYYNQESILAGNKNFKLSGYPQFNSPQEVGDAFIDAGFNLVSLANNHTLDKYEKGVKSSVEYWKTKNVYWTGQALSEEERTKNIRVEEKNGIKYAFLAYTTQTNGLLPPKGKEYLTNIYSPEKAKKDIDLIKDKVDVILVAMHWGVEYQTSGVAQEQKTIAKYLASLGVDIIIGAHPHVVQPAEYIDDTLVIYSLGNFVASQSNNTGATAAEKATGLMMSANIIKTTDTKTGKSEIKVVDPTASFTYAYKTAAKKNYKIYPYNKLNNNLFPGYKNQYEKLKKRMTSLDSSIKVEDIG
ncbi:MAG: CapA family protein [Bacilli bacterium]|nr:CapA family protein [Bacilli bacterium]